MALNLEMTHLGHVHRFNVALASTRGWDVREEQDATVLFEAHRNSWSRVELDMERFRFESALAQAGRMDRADVSRGPVMSRPPSLSEVRPAD